MQFFNDNEEGCMKQTDCCLDPVPFLHVDDFIDNCSGSWIYDAGTRYAAFFFHLQRLPADRWAAWQEFYSDITLFCTWKGYRYRVTGASRMGDVWLVEDELKDSGYDHRVNIAECSGWHRTRIGNGMNP